MKVFIADDVNEEKLAPLIEAGIDVVKETKLAPDALAERLKDADGVIVRSATKITADIMDAAQNLRVIGRAGVGVDNIDVKAATARGIVVMNAPDGNTITTAEHTIALLVSMARNVPQAHAKLQNGEWDKKSFVGVELNGKTLGVIGLGRIGKHVAHVAKGLGMRIVAYDPFTSAEQAAELAIETATLDDVFRQGDFITIHTPVTDETRGIIGANAFAKMKKGVRIVNCARGGLVDEAALIEAIDNGTVAAAALDVFATEPLPADSPLLHRQNIITTPHLGASTTEAQEGVALTVAEQMRDYLLHGELRGAVNAPSLAASELAALQPFIDLGEKLGRFQAQISDQSALSGVRLEYTGELADRDAAPVTRAFLAGLLRDVSSRVNVVNALHIADERGIKVTTSYSTSATRGGNADILTAVTTNDGEQTLSGRVFLGGEGRITAIGNFGIEVAVSGQQSAVSGQQSAVSGQQSAVSGQRSAVSGQQSAVSRGSSLPTDSRPLSADHSASLPTDSRPLTADRYFLVTKNNDVPGVIGELGTILGRGGVNISDFFLGRQPEGGQAVAVIRVDSPPDDSVLNEIRSMNAVILVKLVRL